tara:strand:+ start:130 stop:549 length:420 start_codon:yes stop_codon:yes gene_type:complete
MEFKISTLPIMILIFSTIIGGLAIVYGDLAGNYNVDVDNSFNKTFNRVQNIENMSISLASEIQKEETGKLDQFFLSGKALLTVPKIIVESVGVTTSLLGSEGGVVQTLGIPPIFTSALITIIIIMLVMAAVSIWARFRT